MGEMPKYAIISEGKVYGKLYQGCVGELSELCGLQQSLVHTTKLHAGLQLVISLFAIASSGIKVRELASYVSATL